MNEYNLLCHNSIVLLGSKIVYIDPYNISDEAHNADYIFCTHGHYDHFSEEDIIKVMNDKTRLITTHDTKMLALGLFSESNVTLVEPNKHYEFDDISFDTVVAYNKEKMYHPKKENWVGYLISLDDKTYYIAGDTDALDELKTINCDVAFLPVGGKYTMDYKEAAVLANAISCDVVVPTHYGTIVGDKDDGEKFAKLVSGKSVNVLI